MRGFNNKVPRTRGEQSPQDQQWSRNGFHPFLIDCPLRFQTKLRLRGRYYASMLYIPEHCIGFILSTVIIKTSKWIYLMIHGSDKLSNYVIDYSFIKSNEISKQVNLIISPDLKVKFIVVINHLICDSFSGCNHLNQVLLKLMLHFIETLRML